MLDPTSRYANLGTATYQDTQADRSIAYIPRRFVPKQMGIPAIMEVTVTTHDRLDLIAARTLGPPDQYWRICDANNAMNPFALTDQVGRTLRIVSPQFQEVTS
jgi:hypothetical protein